MVETDSEASMLPMPGTVKKAIFLIALAKAGVAGAGVGLAALGVADVAFAVSAQQWWDSIKPDQLINAFALTGGALGVATKVFSAIWG